MHILCVALRVAARQQKHNENAKKLLHLEKVRCTKIKSIYSVRLR